MAVFHNTNAMKPSTDEAYDAGLSCRFDTASASYLSRTFGTATDIEKWTYSLWAKTDTSSGMLLTQRTDDYELGWIGWSAMSGIGEIGISSTTGPPSVKEIELNPTWNQSLRDPAAWYHICITLDVSESTASDRVKMWINGVQFTDWFSSPIFPTESTHFNSANEHLIGSRSDSSSWDFGGYMADIHFIDGQAKTAADFAETDANGLWVPKEYTGTYGNNGFRLDFDDDSALGNDVSGNNNDWTATNLGSHDQVLDMPTVGKNFATLNPLEGVEGSLGEGNLLLTTSSASGDNFVPTTMGVDYGSGKWYFEVRVHSAVGVGLGVGPGGSATYTGEGSTIGLSQNAGTNCQIYSEGSSTQTLASVSAGDVLSAAVDLSGSNRTIQFYKNGSTFGTAETIPTGWDAIIPMFGGGSVTETNYINMGQDATFAGKDTSGTSTSQGEGEWRYAPPSGYLAFCTANLPTPTLNNAKASEKAFEVATWTGNSTARDISLDFNPDLIWIKNRDNLVTHVLHDTLRGTDKALGTDNDYAETEYSPDSLLGFSPNGSGTGFYLGTYNYVNGSAYGDFVAWSWKEGATPGFDIVTWEGDSDETDGGSRDISHNLTEAPELIIVKARDNAQDWAVYHKDVGNDKFLVLNTDAAPVSTDYLWSYTTPTSSVFTVGNDDSYNSIQLNKYDEWGSGAEKYVAYLWESIPGFSKVGKYTGNGDADGPFVHLGFKPAFVMIKNIVTASSSDYSWWMHDASRNPNNSIDTALWADFGYAEASNESYYLDFLSNGFKPRTDDSHFNTDDTDYIYLAFAEAPFKYANAR